VKSHPGLCHGKPAGRPAASSLGGVFIGDLPPTLEAAVLQQKLVEEVGSMINFKMGSGGPQMQGLQWATVEFAEKGCSCKGFGGSAHLGLADQGGPNARSAAPLQLQASGELEVKKVKKEHMH
jgi:hypothetical protein